MRLIDNNKAIPKTNLGGITWIAAKKEGDDLVTIKSSTCRELYTLYIIEHLAKLATSSDKLKFFSQFIIVGCSFNKKDDVISMSTTAVKLLNIIEDNNGWKHSTLVPIEKRLKNKAIFSIKPSAEWLRSTHTLSLCLLIINSAFSISVRRVRTYNGLMARYKRCSGKYRHDLQRLGKCHTVLFSNWKSLFKGLSKISLFTHNASIYNMTSLYTDGFRSLMSASSSKKVINNRSIKYLKGNHDD